jgi:hypothetical protein
MTVLRRAVLISAVPVLMLAFVTVRGVDFGRYWDDESMATKVELSLASPPTLLPYAYDYPSVTYWIALAGIAPEAVRDPKLRYRIPDTSGLVAFTKSDRYRLRLRAMFAILSSLALVWIAALSLAAGGTAWEAFGAAALAASSWELSYQLRWIAPDGLTMEFVALSVWLMLMAIRTPHIDARRWLLAAAAAVGVATGTKYSVWPLVIPLAAAAWTVNRTARRPLATVGWIIGALAFAVGCYLVTTPGSILQPTLFVAGLRYQVNHYATEHGVYTIARGARHLLRMLQYIAFVLPSPYAPIAAGCGLLAVVGAYDLARRARTTAFIAMAFPVFFVAYFSIQRVMIVRNLLVLAPFLAVLTARGARALWDASARSSVRAPLRTAIAAAGIVVIAANARFEFAALDSIVHRSHGRTLEEFARWAAEQPPGRVALSAPLASALAASGTRVDGPPQADASVAYFPLEPAQPRLPANDPWTFAESFGPREVNLNFYPDWIGDAHIVVISAARARRFGVQTQSLSEAKTVSNR